jgi:hypothetical protein
LKKLDFAQTIGLLANLGVIAGIVFLGLELQQNNALLASQSRAIQLSQQSALLNSFSHSQMVEMTNRVSAGQEPTPGQQLVMVTIANKLFDFWEWQYFENKAGMLDEEQLPIFAMRNWYFGRTEIPIPVQQMWERRKGAYSEDFINFFEENVIAE